MVALTSKYVLISTKQRNSTAMFWFSFVSSSLARRVLRGNRQTACFIWPVKTYQNFLWHLTYLWRTIFSLNSLQNCFLQFFLWKLATSFVSLTKGTGWRLEFNFPGLSTEDHWRKMYLELSSCWRCKREIYVWLNIELLSPASLRFSFRNLFGTI